MRYFVTGVNGQLGHDVKTELHKRGHEVVGSDISVQDGTEDISLDITEKKEVEEIIKAVNPDIVIHCAAWTNVDAAEDDENKETVFKINADGTQNIANACRDLNCKMIYISTDYVFSGDGTEPWEPDCNEFKPLNQYGLSKLEGEQAVASTLDKFFIVRIAWVFGNNGNNFVDTMLKLSEKYETLTVVCDQIGTPTYTFDLARLLVDMSETDKYGYYHVTNEGGFISWYDFACEIFKQAGSNVEVKPVTTAEYGISKAKRPYNSRLNKEKIAENGFAPLPDWRDALMRYLRERNM